MRLRHAIFLGLSPAFLAGPAIADSLPPSVRACIGEADAARRLACYDREVARLIAPAGTFAPVASGPTAAPATYPPAAAAPPVAGPDHFKSKVSAVRQSGDHLVVKLESGDVWEQSAPATSQLNVHPGDEIQMDREIGGWFLTNRYGDNIQVRLRRP